MAKRTAGQRWEPDGGGKDKKPLKSAQDIAAEAAQVTDKFPDKLPSAIEALNKLSATEVKSQEDWEALQPKLHALRLHVHKLQQGLPVLASSSGDFDHGHMRSVMQELQLKQLVRTNPLIKDLLEERDALLKAKAPEALTSRLAELEAALAAAEAKILELTKTTE